MLRLDRLACQELIQMPYPHVACGDALTQVQDLNADFPPPESFGPTIRMDGDLTACDAEYEALVARSAAYASLHRQVYSLDFIQTFLDLFRAPLQHALATDQLLADPFALKRVAEPIEKRVTGGFAAGPAEPIIYPRFDIGYGGVGYGVHNGGRGVHIDNLPRLVSILVFLNTPRSMTGGSHRLYGLRDDTPILAKQYRPTAGLLIASLQSNRAFHDVEPVTEIEGERRAFYIALSCSQPIWKKEQDRKLMALSRNRYEPPPPPRIANRMLRLLSILR